MLINLSLKVQGGKRTPVTVTCYPTAINDKVMIFANGKCITGNHIAEYIEKDLGEKLSLMQSEERDADA